eukprot:CAMPEP_0204642148 /NCGR_PEP_ID=MMETSP0717-20131115/51530_1 /ASSEMBLY_ACC=CAM_ASM_000666 /TAXON_ID=230516 /ORGANISM="Chaetoceros curvisetus" /LENGTH=739 /DNA_ID=CAMNT_0051662897 /DNA_START=489 /DNA_END=2708 /DNA_ORIENTATION=-
MAVQITVPPVDTVENLSSNVAVLTCAEGEGGGGAVRMNSEARIINQNSSQEEMNMTGSSSGAGATTHSQQQQSSSSPPRQPRAYQVVIPPNVRPGTNFPVLLNGQQIQVQCPLNARPGMTLRINPPPSLLGPPEGMQSATDLSRPPDRPGQGGTSGNSNGNSNTGGGSRMVNQMFEVTVPQGVRPNQPFSLLAGGQRVLVTCPPNARPGTRIRFNLPVPVGGGTEKKTGGKDSNKKKDVTLKYDTQDGWTRSIRVTDMKFTWVRLDQDGELGTDDGTFRVDTSAFVRKVTFLQGNDDRMRTGKVSLIPASEYSVDSVIGKDPDAKNASDNNKDDLLVGEGELANVQTKSMEEKVTWMLKTCKKLGIPWEEGHMRICVRREHLLVDSIQAVMSLGRKDLRKIWRFEFMGEDGIDAGGLAKEWFLLVTKAIFDADSGLWVSSEGNQMLMRINPASEATCPEDHLIYFRFLGRVLGKAVFEGQLVSGHMVQYLYKYLLGWPITFDDLESVDADLHQNLKKLLDVKPEEVEYLCLDFTAAQNRLGETIQIKLVPDGEDKAVTGDNLSEYLEVYFKYIMLERIKPQLTEFLLGFYDVLPEPLLSVFDYQELELIMCGLPTIDMDDWIKHSIYAGTFSDTKARSQACKWFWEIVRNDFDQEMRARLLQFVTGTSGVPSRGFSVLQGSDGNIKLFCLNGVQYKSGAYPRAHTCFNRLDLPMYKSKKDLREKLTFAVTNCSTGFTVE